MFKDFTTDTGQRDGSVIFCLGFMTFLVKGVTEAFFQSSGTTPSAKRVLKYVRIGAISL